MRDECCAHDGKVLIEKHAGNEVEMASRHIADGGQLPGLIEAVMRRPLIW
jgi:hypothetical protein